MLSMRALVLLVLLAVALAGCAVSPRAEPVSVARDGPLAGVRSVGLGVPEGSQHAPWSRATVEPARDPDSPPVTLDGEPSFALAALVRERWGDGDDAYERHPCGGALVAAPADSPDPRGHFDAFAFAENATVVDATGRAWTTDRYVARLNASFSIWVQNVGGGGTFVPDDGGDCPAPIYEKGPLNVLLHAEGPEMLSLWFSPGSRPAPSGPSPS